MVNTLADDVDIRVDNQPIVRPEQGQLMRQHTPQSQPPAPAPRPQTPDPRPRPRTLETHPLSWLEHLGLVTLQRPCPALPSLREAEAAGNTSDVDVDQQLLIESAGGDSLPDVPLPDVPPSDDPLPDVVFPVARLDGIIGDVGTSPRVAQEAMVISFGLGSGSCLVRFLCSNLFIPGID